MRLSLQLLRRAIESDYSASLPPGSARLPALCYPLFPAPRTAVLGASLHEQPGVHSLPQWTPPQLERLRPHALAGDWGELSTVARLMRDGIVSLPDLRYPIVVFSSTVAGPLSQERHLLLWDWFHLPTFEQIRGADMRLLATECEARSGFHLSAGVSAGELGALAIAGNCGCGSREPLFRIALQARLAAAGS